MYYARSLFTDTSFAMSARKKARSEETTSLITVNKASSEGQQWFPLQSDSYVMNALVEKMGFDTSLYEFTDIWSIEPDEIENVPKPVSAVMMLYNVTEVQKQYHQNEKVTPTHNNIWFIQDRIEFACGSIGLLHALFNAPEGVRTSAIRPNSWLHSFYDNCPVAMHPYAKADAFEGDSTIKMLHNKAASNMEECPVTQSTAGKDEQLTGHTVSESKTDEIIGHFITMVHVNGGLYELDGRRDGPVRHGDTTQVTLLEDACKVVKKIMKRDPNEWHFSIMALVPKRD